jgi:predicted ATP-grasp superfamily ATP-dependent carboligase
VNRAAVVADLKRLGRAIQWHGALMLDYMFDDRNGAYLFIDPNPRLGETMNALLSGVDLPQALVEVTQGRRPVTCSHSDKEVRSHILLSALLATAIKARNRRAVLSQLLSSWRHMGQFADSREEIALVSEDYLSLVPTLAVAVQLLLRAGQAQAIATHAIGNYALSARAVDIVRESWQERQRDAC